MSNVKKALARTPDATAKDIKPEEYHRRQMAAHNRCLKHARPYDAFVKAAKQYPGLARIVAMGRERVERLAAEYATQPEPAKRPVRPSPPALSELIPLIGNRWLACLSSAGVVDGRRCVRCDGRSVVESSGHLSCPCRQSDGESVLVAHFGSRPLAATWLADWLTSQRRGKAVASIESRETIAVDKLAAWSRMPTSNGRTSAKRSDEY